MKFIGLVCKYEDCNLIYEDPVVLPCGRTLCQKHLENFDDNFKCPYCHEDHHKPSKNVTICGLLDMYNQLDPLRKTIKESFDNLDESIKEYENTESDVYIDTYFYEIRNKVDLHREELKKEIDERSDEIIQQLKDKEKKCKEYPLKLEKINLDELKSNILNWKQQFRDPDYLLNELLYKLNKSIQNIEYSLTKYKSDLVLNESIKFDKYENSSLFGVLKIINDYHGIEFEKNQHYDETEQHSGIVRSTQVDMTSSKLISCSQDNTIKIWCCHTGLCLKTLKHHPCCVTCVTSIIIMPNNRIITAADKTIKMWNLDSYYLIKTLKQKFSVGAMCLTSENQIACGCDEGYIDIWDLDNSIQVKSVRVHNDWITQLLFVDNTKLISACKTKDKTIKIHRLETFECIQVLETHSNTIRCIELMTEGNLISCLGDKTAKLWHLSTGNLLKTIQFESAVYCSKVLNNDLIAFGLQDGTIHIKAISTGQTIQILQAGPFSVFHLNLLSNGNLLSGCGNGEIILWKKKIHFN